jgi:aminoglycoside N3'-acetyltransferase
MSSLTANNKGNEFSAYWQNSGIEQGDTILVHSSMRRTYRELHERGMNMESTLILDSLLGVLGSKGTLILPLFNFDFPTSKFFSMNDTSSQMGRITEDARLNYSGIRTGHPIYSFYVIGHHQQEFSGIENKSGYGEDSPFAKLLELDGKIGVIDLDDQDSMTMYHHVEEKLGVSYRYHKEFGGNYVDSKGESSFKTFSVFVRDLEQRVKTNVNNMGEILWQEGIYTGSRPGTGNGLRVGKAREIFLRTSQEIEAGKALGTLYSID